MDAEQIRAWKVERDIARQSGNPELVQKAYDHRDEMMMECIQHQADRVKTGLANDAILDKDIKSVKRDVEIIKQELVPLKESDKDYRAWKLRFQGGVLLWRLLKYGGACGLGAVIYRLLTGGGS